MLHSLAQEGDVGNAKEVMKVMMCAGIPASEHTFAYFLQCNLEGGTVAETVALMES